MGKMKLGVSITAFREPLIKQAIKQYEGIADKIIVSCAKKSWYNDMDNDDTADKARKTSATVFEDLTGWEHEHRNKTMDQMRDMDYVIVAHGDTWFLREDLKRLKEMSLDKLHYACNVYTYWKNDKTVIYPYISLPTLFVRSDAIFRDVINIDNQEANPEVLPITCYHTSWLKTDDEVKKKITSYSHAGEIRPDWFENIWKKWTPEMTDFAPTNPSDYKSTREHPLPEEIKRRLK